jgi:hypothetical protein
MISLSPLLNKLEGLTSASPVNRYAHHIDPTITVIFIPILALSRLAGRSRAPERPRATPLGGPAAFGASICGWGTYSKIVDMPLGQVSRPTGCPNIGCRLLADAAPRDSLSDERT